jgi:spermidine/putrescine transport system substrate-binding protein
VPEFSRDDEPVRILAPTETSDRLRRRTFLQGALAAAAGGGLLAACGDDSTGSAPGATVDPSVGTGAVEGQLNIYTWAEYDNPDVLTAFTKDKGPKLQVSNYASNEEMIAKLVAAKGTGGYDIVVPTGSFIPQMSANGLLEKLNKAALPNLANVDQQFLDQPWDRGNVYSVCKDWGTTGFCYDTTKITRELTSWADFLDAAQKEASGTTSLLDDPGEICGTWFWSLDIDWNTTDAAQLDAAEQFLVGTLAPHVKAFESYPSAAMPQGEYTLVHAWNGDARLGMLESDPGRWKWVFPSPHSNLWMDNWAIPVGAKNVNAAYAWINYILDPKVSLTELEYIGYNTGIKDIEATAKAKGVELPELIFFTADQVTAMVPGEVNEAHQKRVEIWNKMKAAAAK